MPMENTDIGLYYISQIIRALSSFHYAFCSASYRSRLAFLRGDGRGGGCVHLDGLWHDCHRRTPNDRSALLLALGIVTPEEATSGPFQHRRGDDSHAVCRRLCGSLHRGSWIGSLRRIGQAQNIADGIVTPLLPGCLFERIPQQHTTRGDVDSSGSRFCETTTDFPFQTHDPAQFMRHFWRRVYLDWHQHQSVGANLAGEEPRSRCGTWVVRHYLGGAAGGDCSCLYLIFVGPWLLPDRKAALTMDSDVRQYTVEMQVDPGSPLDGASIENAGLRHLPGMYPG